MITEELRINAKAAREKIVKFIRGQTKSSGFEKVVFGLSGGVDSSLVAYLCCQALGKDNVTAVILPYKETVPESLDFAGEIVKALGMGAETIDITPLVDAYFEGFSEADRLRRGNMTARVRMTVLYDRSRAHRALVVGCGNKSEIMLGYCTIYGDNACAFVPLGNLYKTQVFQLAKEVGVPGPIINATPSAGLWSGQSDEDELGFSYGEGDRALFYMVDKGLPEKKLYELGISKGLVRKVRERIEASEFKRRMPPAAKI